MDKINRTKVEKPDCLTDNDKKWTLDWKTRIKEGKKFTWHNYKTMDCQKTISKALSQITNSHCSYCGIYKLERGRITPTIDHFKPKSIYPDLSFEWSNLFISCNECQKYKGSFFPNNKEQNFRGNFYPKNIEPLKPDDKDYFFDYWFQIDWRSNKILPNEIRTKDEQKKALITINFFCLNEDGRPEAREEELLKYTKTQDINIFSYVFFLERG